LRRRTTKATRATARITAAPPSRTKGLVPNDASTDFGAAKLITAVEEEPCASPDQLLNSDMEEEGCAKRLTVELMGT
jgi:hypothetical protein